jgi:sec-independent protein translocase protein TatB
MFGISFPELIVIFVVLLLVVGPDKLPEIAHTIGKIMGEFKKNSDKLRREFYNSTYKPLEEAQNSLQSVKRELRTARDETIKEMLSPPVAKDPLCPDTAKTQTVENNKITGDKNAEKEGA